MDATRGMRVRGDRGTAVIGLRREANYPLQGEIRYFPQTNEGRPYTAQGLLRAIALWLQQHPARSPEAIMLTPELGGWSGTLLHADDTPAATVVAA